MILIIKGSDAKLESTAVRGMHVDRKRVFSDLLRWNVPIVQGRYEIDQFDSCHATYIVVVDGNGGHLASARLLETTRDHILGSIFPHLCEDTVPAGHDIVEITRFCLSPSLKARERRLVRRQLVTALAEHGVDAGIATYTGVAERFWFDQIVTFGWRCSPLAALPASERKALVGLRIDLDGETLDALRRGGMHADIQWHTPGERLAA